MRFALETIAYGMATPVKQGQMLIDWKREFPTAKKPLWSLNYALKNLEMCGYIMGSPTNKRLKVSEREWWLTEKGYTYLLIEGFDREVLSAYDDLMGVSLVGGAGK